MKVKYKKLFKKNLRIIVPGLLVIGLSVFAIFFQNDSPEVMYPNEAAPIIVDENIEEEVEEPVVVEQDLLGRAELSYAGGTEGRNKNIELGVARINGTVVQPGAEFSFSRAIGPVTKADGFSEEKIFLNGEVTKGLGGGLCQVSTLLFQTILNTGLPVTERHNHSYTVSYYDVGVDATYSNPGPDLKFRNDTGNPITIVGRTEGQKVIFEIIGVDDGRTASVTEPEVTNIVDFPPTRYVTVASRDSSLPECINSPQIGYTARVTYTVTYKNGDVKEKIFTSRYNPLQRVCYIVASAI